MSLSDVIVFIVVGLIAGFLASRLILGKGRGWFFDIVIGIIGAFIGGWLFGRLGIAAGGIIGMIIAATVGAIILIALLRMIKRA